jgi:two-component system cell cycle response regulator
MNRSFPLLVVEENRKRITGMLRGAGYRVSPVPDGAEAVNLLRKESFAAVISDLPFADGLELCRRIRKEQFPGYIYVLLLVAKRSKENLRKAWEAGADQSLMKPLLAEDLIACLKAARRILDWESLLKKRNEKFRVLSTQDPLTRAFNRAYLDEQIPNEIKKYFRYSQSLSLILCDIDGFKKFNDSYGHLAGDFILKKFVDLLKKSIRNGVDWVARFGGDEFLVALPNTDLKGAGNVAQRLCRLVAEEVFRFKKLPLRVTASFGVTWIGLPRRDARVTQDILIEEADECLSWAKKSGGNRIRVRPSLEPCLLGKKGGKAGRFSLVI